MRQFLVYYQSLFLKTISTSFNVIFSIHTLQKSFIVLYDAGHTSYTLNQ